MAPATLYYERTDTSSKDTQGRIFAADEDDTSRDDPFEVEEEKEGLIDFVTSHGLKASAVYRGRIDKLRERIQSSLLEQLHEQLADFELTLPDLSDAFERYTEHLSSKSPSAALGNVVLLSSADARRVSEDSLAARFRRLADQWRLETMAESSITRAAINPNYQQIIGMGPRAIPYILSELATKGGHWYWALRMITGEDPVPEESKGKVRQMRQHWIEWGKRHDYL